MVQLIDKNVLAFLGEVAAKVVREHLVAVAVHDFGDSSTIMPDNEHKGSGLCYVDCVNSLAQVVEGRASLEFNEATLGLLSQRALERLKAPHFKRDLSVEGQEVYEKLHLSFDKRSYGIVQEGVQQYLDETPPSTIALGLRRHEL